MLCYYGFFSQNVILNAQFVILKGVLIAQNVILNTQFVMFLTGMGSL